MKVTSYYDVKVVEIIISGEDNIGFFEDKICFIYNPLEDMHNGNHSLYDLCEKQVNELNIGSQCIYNAFATVYTLDRQVVNSFDVL